MSQEKVLLIVNPAAGKMRSKTALFTLVDTFCRNGYQVTVQTTGGRGDAREAAMTMTEGQDLVVCCGGDGTLNEVIDGLLQSGRSIPLGYVPAGSTNDFANSLHLSSRPDVATRAIVEGEARGVDIGLFNNSRHFAYIASFGAFTAASYSAPQATKNALGHFAYILEGIKELSALQSYRIRVETDQRVFEDEFLFGAVCNSTSVAGLVKLDEGLVDMSDGLFEIVLVRQPKVAGDLSKILLALNTGDFNNDMFEFFKTSHITFRMKTPMPWSLDGEFEEGAPVVTVENLPQALLLKR